MWIHPDLRGSGLADRLAQSVLAWAREAGASRVLLHVDKRNLRARRFYERNGFRSTGREIVRDRDGLPEVEMEAGLDGTRPPVVPNPDSKEVDVKKHTPGANPETGVAGSAARGELVEETLRLDGGRELPEYVYPGARAQVELHEIHLRSFLSTWKLAVERGLELPETSDPAYVSLNTLVRHVLGAARGYMTWMCEVLGLPDPGIDPAPEPAAAAAGADAYLETVLRGWRLPLSGVPETAFEPETHTSRWGAEMTVESMLEHAVMHPIRHEFQLRKLLNRG
jgi:hypothetical protein